jgi:hypothetical protein
MKTQQELEGRWAREQQWQEFRKQKQRQQKRETWTVIGLVLSLTIGWLLFPLNLPVAAVTGWLFGRKVWREVQQELRRRGY